MNRWVNLTKPSGTGKDETRGNPRPKEYVKPTPNIDDATTCVSSRTAANTSAGNGDRMESDSNSQLQISEVEKLRNSSGAVRCADGVLVRRESEKRLTYIATGYSDAQWQGLIRGWESLACDDLFFHMVDAGHSRKFCYCDFAVAGSYQSLRERCEKVPEQMKEFPLFQKIFVMLNKYRTTLCSQGEKYEPLNCLTPDLVWISDMGEIKLLPLRPLKSRFAPEIAPEAESSEKYAHDMRLDLYSLGRLIVEARTDVNDPRSREIMEEDPDLHDFVLRMTSAFVDERPTQVEIAQWLKEHSNHVQQKRTNVDPADPFELKSKKKSKEEPDDWGERQQPSSAKGGIMSVIDELLGRNKETTDGTSDGTEYGYDDTDDEDEPVVDFQDLEDQPFQFSEQDADDREE